jgi:hypothetical protein
MVCAETAAETETRRRAFAREWRLERRAAADSLEEAEDRLFAFARLGPPQRTSARTTDAIERPNEEPGRRIEAPAVRPCAETAPALLRALPACGQITMREAGGGETLADPSLPCPSTTPPEKPTGDHRRSISTASATRPAETRSSDASWNSAERRVSRDRALPQDFSPPRRRWVSIPFR